MISCFIISAMMQNAAAQTRYSSYNTAQLDSLKGNFNSVCTSMVSSKRATRKAIRQDRRRIQFLNEFYNLDLPIEDIRQKMNRFFNFKWDFETQNLGQITKYETRIQSNGNLNLQISFSTYRNEIIFKHFHFTTSTRTDCIEPTYFYGISQIDLEYLKENVTPIADFPMHDILKHNSNISCDTIYYSKLAILSDSGIFPLNTLFSLDVYVSQHIDDDILKLVNEKDTEKLTALLYSPNYYVAIHAMEALKYLKEEKRVEIPPIHVTKMKLIEGSDFPLTWQYSDVVKHGASYRDVDMSLRMIKLKYDKALEEINKRSD